MTDWVDGIEERNAGRVIDCFYPLLQHSITPSLHFLILQSCGWIAEEDPRPSDILITRSRFCSRRSLADSDLSAAKQQLNKFLIDQVLLIREREA